MSDFVLRSRIRPEDHEHPVADDARRGRTWTLPPTPAVGRPDNLRKLTLDPPSDVRLPVQELVTLLGEPSYARVEDAGAVRNDFAFALPRGWAKCYLEVDTDLQGEDVHRQHVIGLQLGQPGPT